MQEQNVYIDRGLKSYFFSIYQYVALNLLLSGATAFYTFSNPKFFNAIFSGGLFYVILFAPFAIALYLGTALQHISLGRAQFCYWAFGVVQGILMSSVFALYTFDSVARCFFISAAVFGAAAFYGRYTSRDLSSMRSVFMIGLFGIIASSLINLFIGSSALQYLISWGVLVIFTGLVAFDMQRLLAIYFTRQSDEAIEKIAIIGALNLFISFINIFMSVLRLFGDRRNN
jgi:FtsH-binding integral membrane protein